MDNEKVKKKRRFPVWAIVLSSILAAVLLYKEKQSKAKYAAFALGAVSLVLLNI